MADATNRVFGYRVVCSRGTRRTVATFTTFGYYNSDLAQSIFDTILFKAARCVAKYLSQMKVVT